MIQSNNASKYTSFKFKEFFNTRGILYATSCVHTPQQNRVGECKHRHILEVTRSSMIHLSVPKHHWPEAILTSCYLINRKPSSAFDNQIPHQILHLDYPLFLILLVVYDLYILCHILTISFKPKPSNVCLWNILKHKNDIVL